MEQTKPEYHVVSLSGGKDSTAMLLMMLERGMQIDDILCDQMIISEEICMELLKLYHTYEFSDRFQVIAGNDRFGGLDNYVKTGILTREEASKATMM